MAASPVAWPGALSTKTGTQSSHSEYSGRKRYGQFVPRSSFSCY